MNPLPHSPHTLVFKILVLLSNALNSAFYHKLYQLKPLQMEEENSLSQLVQLLQVYLKSSGPPNMLLVVGCWILADKPLIVEIFSCNCLVSIKVLQ